MRILKLLLCCLCCIVFVIKAKTQVLVDTNPSYQFIERQLNVPNSLAKIIIKNKKGQVLVVSKSLAFDLQAGERIQSKNSHTTLYLYALDGQVDSIQHANVAFSYVIKKRTLQLEIPDKGNHPTVYTNSLQKMEIKAKRIDWQIDSNQLYFDGNQAPICFTSRNYFDASLMEAYQSLGNTNPLVKMALYAQKKGAVATWFDIAEMALLFNKRLEGMVFMDSIEIEKARKNPSFKIIEKAQDFDLFKKGYPKVFKFAGIHVNKVKTLIQYSVIDAKTVLPLYLRMVKDGFLDYNKTTKKIRLRPKLFHYVAAMNRASDYDYDHLKFWTKGLKDTSTILRTSLNLATQILAVSKVKKITFGLNQQVIAQPSLGVALLPNRRIKFDGQLWTGKTCFLGTDFQFVYDNYRVLLPKVDQVHLAIYQRVRFKNEWRLDQVSIGRSRALDAEGVPTKAVENIKSTIEGIKGYLQIDTFTNQSGKNEANAVAPILVSESTARVYYDKRKAEGRAIYPRDSFYYELAPFRLSRVNELEMSQFLFKGKFYSANIFPVLNNDLKLQFSDLSLGFDTSVIGAIGLPIYQGKDRLGKGNFRGQLQLSNAGLYGNGVINYLGAVLGCDAFEFLPKSVEARQIDSFELKASKEFPTIKAKHIRMSWKPYENRMYLNSIFTEGFPFHFYYKQQKYMLDGQLTISPQGIVGQGTLDWHQASIVSNPKGDYQINAKQIESKSVDVLLKLKGRAQFGFEQANVALKIDFKQEVAYFSSQDTNAKATFPFNGYQTNCKEFRWNWTSNQLFMTFKDGQKGRFEKEGNRFKSLSFEAAKGRYDLETGLLELRGLAPIKIGNAFLYLSDSILEIEANAPLQKLEGNLVIINPMKSLCTLDSIVLIWNPKTTSFISKGMTLQLNSGEDNTRKTVQGKLEILPQKEGLLLRYCWILPDGSWYFFKWEKGSFGLISSTSLVDDSVFELIADYELFRKRWF